MKKLFAGIAILGTVAFASAQTISFDKTTWDYGTVKNGAEGHRNFTVTNTGDKPLIISKVQASCGCTTPEFSQEPIMPGKSSVIKVGYNTALNGPFQKLIEVYSNDPANSRSVIYIKGNVDSNAAANAVQVEAVPVASAQLKAETASPARKAATKTAVRKQAASPKK